MTADVFYEQPRYIIFAGIPAEYIEAGRNATVVTEISKSGDVVTITRKRPKRTATNSFKLGEETEIDTVKGDKAKVCIFEVYQQISCISRSKK